MFVILLSLYEFLFPNIKICTKCVVYILVGLIFENHTKVFAIVYIIYIYIPNFKKRGYQTTNLVHTFKNTILFKYCGESDYLVMWFTHTNFL